MADLVTDGATGWHFESGNARSLADTVSRVFDEPDTLAAARKTARAEYESRFREEGNLDLLMDIYRAAIDRRHHDNREDR
jgi:glycosyltransferase involved in cell wall biosynthesis